MMTARNNCRALRAAGIAVLVALVAGAATRPVAAGTHDRSYLTFNHAVALPGVVLPAGSYVFENVTPMSSAGVVRVLSRDLARVHFAGFTHRVRRPNSVGRQAPVILGEARNGQPLPIETWFPIGETYGYAFIW